MQNVTTTSQRVATLGRQGPALGLLLLLVCAVAAAVLAVGGTAVSLLADARRRLFELAALRVIGVPRRTLRNSAMAEQALLLGAALVLGLPSGFAAAALVLPVVPEFSDPTPDRAALPAAGARRAGLRAGVRDPARHHRGGRRPRPGARGRPVPAAGVRPMTTENAWFAEDPWALADQQPDTDAVRVEAVALTHVYVLPDESVTALEDVNFTVRPGDRLAVLGPSGSGKSTLLTLLAGLHRPTSGQLRVGEDDLATLSERALLGLRGTRIATVVQNPGRNLLPYATAEDNIRFAQRPIPRSRRARLPRPGELLERLGLTELAGRPIARLSGGEQQRLGIAVGLARSPGLLLLDEPTSQLDRAGRDRVLALLERVTADGACTTIAVTHDPAVADAMGAALTLADGRVVHRA